MTLKCQKELLRTAIAFDKMGKTNGGSHIAFVEPH